MISSILLENWRTHKKSVLNFDKGTNVIVGVMGAGKSSIVNAISYGLFGTFPALKSRQVSLEEIIMNKPNKAENAKVVLKLIHGKKNYLIERIIFSKGTNTAKLYEEEKLIAGPKQTEVNESVEKILGLNYDLFSRAIYSEQNETDFFLKLSPRERKQKFDELLELEKYEIARKNSVSLQNQFKRREIDEKEFLELQKKNLERMDETKIVEIINIEKKEIEKLEVEHNTTTKNLLISEKELKILEEKEKENKVYTDLLLKTELRIESIKEELEKNQKLSVKSISEKIDEKQEQLNKNENLIKEIEKEILESEKNGNKTKEDVKVFYYKINELEKEIKQMNSIGSKCSVCKQDLNEEHRQRIISQNFEKTKNIEKQIKELETILNKTNKELMKNKEIKLLKNKEVEKNRKEIYSLENELKKANEVEEKKKQLEKLLTEPEKLKNEIKKIGFNKLAFDNEKNHYYENKHLLTSITTKISSKKEIIISQEKNLLSINEMKKNINAIEKRVSKFNKGSEQLGVFSNCLTATQTELRESMISNLNYAMSTIWENIYPYKDYIDAKLAVTNDGYDLMVKNRNKEWVRVDGILSGGERSAAAICIRVSFALVLTKNLSMLILDEPTHNLDSNAIKKLSEMLREKIPSLVDQIFIITHDKELEKATSSNLHILQRNKDLDESTRIEFIEKI